MSLLLSRDELEQLTGCKRRSGVCRWLRERGWIFETTANGWPVVSVAYMQGKLGGTIAAPLKGPNLEALRNIQRAA
ncbi:DUF4224 domain-containing protein [Panacagrimonas sp.]|uniref:DUF4224 domain-containing protein n=1 Tax=Panacagrimonas sp. TaxID=2480088 RepID=UPI003B5300CA